MGLKGKTAIVTGGSRGIGRAIALRLAKDGANVAVLNLQKDLGLKVAVEIRKFGVEAIPLACDITDYQTVKKLIRKRTIGKTTKPSLTLPSGKWTGITLTPLGNPGGKTMKFNVEIVPV